MGTVAVGAESSAASSLLVSGRLETSVRRILEGVMGVCPSSPGTGIRTLVLSSGSVDWKTPTQEERRGDDRAKLRILVLSALGAHPDAKARRLRRLWEVEEKARLSGLPTLTWRLGPLVGPRSPLWWKLRTRPWLPFHARTLVAPIVEAEVVEALVAVLSTDEDWSGCYEVAGPERLTLQEWIVLATASGPPAPRGPGEWEPPLEEMREHGLAEPGPWYERFDVHPLRVSVEAGGWA